jgi:hypothetical protein
MANKMIDHPTCKWCGNLAIRQAGSVHICVPCRERINEALRMALELQRREGLSDRALVEHVGITGFEAWRRIRRQLEDDPDAVIHTSCVSPANPLLPPPAPDDAYVRPSRGWESRAACRNHREPDLFFPDPSLLKPHRINKRLCGRPGCDECDLRDRVAAAHGLCATCAVARECQASRTEHGVWGGVLQKERKA